MSQDKKNALRTKFIQWRSGLNSSDRLVLNLELNKILSFVWVEGGGLSQSTKPLWVGYKALASEADPKNAIEDSMPYLQWAYPKVLDENQMEFYVPAIQDAVWNKTSLGIWEPSPLTAQKIDISKSVGILVPGVAFDRKGRRLGFGKGYYDKCLAGFSGIKVGVCFSAQLVDGELPHDERDVDMDLIATEKEIIHIKRSRH